VEREEIKTVITRERDRPFLFEGIPKGIAEGNPIKAIIMRTGSPTLDQL